MATIRIIVNRQKAAHNRKFKERLPEEPTLSIHRGSEIDYAFGVKLTGEWNIVQDYANSPCSGAHIWIEGEEPQAQYEITHRKPQSESHESLRSDTTQDPANDSDTPKPDKPVEFF